MAGNVILAGLDPTSANLTVAPLCNRGWAQVARVDEYYKRQTRQTASRLSYGWNGTSSTKQVRGPASLTTHLRNISTTP